MDELPAPKLPCDFTGQGLEIIGDPSGDFEGISLWFEDGIFCLIETSSVESIPEWTASTVLEHTKACRHNRAIYLAELKATRQASDCECAELDRILQACRAKPRQKRTEDAVRAIITLPSILKKCEPSEGDIPEEEAEKKAKAAKANIDVGKRAGQWSLTDPLERAAVIAVMQLAKELCRPPSGDETIDRMKRLRDEMDTMKPFLTTDGDRNNIARFLRKNGFGWLEFRGRGYQGKRE